MISKWAGTALLSFVTLSFVTSATAQQASKACFTPAARAAAERTAKLWMDPAGYDPVLGFDPAVGPRRGTPPAGENGLTSPIKCVANKDNTPGSGTTPKFHCSIEGVTDKDGELIRYKVKPHFKGQSPEKRNGEIYGEFLSSRFSRALGFFADDEWVADVTCPDCEKSLTGKFQSGAAWNPFQPAAGVELNIGNGIDVGCDSKDSSKISSAIDKLIIAQQPLAEIDAFKLWLAFIDHGDTKTDNQKYTCLETVKNADGTLSCAPGQAVFYVSDMGSTFGHSTASESKARLEKWRGKDPIKVNDKGRCTSTAKDAGDPAITEAGRELLSEQLQRLLDAERSNGTITKVFRASRNAERDAPPEAWTAEFIRKANTIINARCSN
jgi:hypothetical protein